MTEPTQCRANRVTSLGDRDELVCPKLAVVTPGNRLPIEETSDGHCSTSCIVHKDAWYVSTVYGRSHAVEGGTRTTERYMPAATCKDAASYHGTD